MLTFDSSLFYQCSEMSIDLDITAKLNYLEWHISSQINIVNMHRQYASSMKLYYLSRDYVHIL